MILFSRPRCKFVDSNRVLVASRLLPMDLCRLGHTNKLPNIYVHVVCTSIELLFPTNFTVKHNQGAKAFGRPIFDI